MERYQIRAVHGTICDWFYAFDTKAHRIMGRANTFQDRGPAGYSGNWAAELIEIQVKALNKGCNHEIRT